MMAALPADQFARIVARDAEAGQPAARVTLTQAAVDRRVLLREVRQLRAAVKAALPFVRPCVRPDFYNGWAVCTHGETWPCSQTNAAWILRGLDPDAEREKEMKRAWADMAYAAELEGGS